MLTLYVFCVNVALMPLAASIVTAHVAATPAHAPVPVHELMEYPTVGVAVTVTTVP
jgi:hypothetical protein